MRKFRNFGITRFSKQASKNSRSSLHFHNAKPTFSNFLISLTTVFPYLDRKRCAMDLSSGNLSLNKNNKAKEMTFNIITLLVVTSLTLQH